MAHKWMNTQRQDLAEIVGEYAKADEHAFMADMKNALATGRRACAVLEVLAATFLDGDESRALFEAVILGKDDLNGSVSRFVAAIGLKSTPRGASP